MDTNVHEQNDNDDDGNNDGGSCVWWSRITKVEKYKSWKASSYDAILDLEGCFQVLHIKGDHTRKSCINFSLIIHFQAQQHVFFTGLKQTNNSEQRS